MIRSIKILSEWPADVPTLKGKTFSFDKKLTVLFGRNGSGKTTLLRTAGAYAGCHQHGGWSSFVTPLESKDPWLDAARKRLPYPEQFRWLAPGHAVADVEWDGAPAFLHLAQESDAKLTSFDDQHDILGDGFGMFHDSKIKSSSGQLRLRRLEQLRATLNRAPDLSRVKQKTVNDLWMGAEERFVNYVTSLRSKQGKSKEIVTVLLDEPDRSMDLEIQAKFWEVGIPKLVSAGFQVVVATHSPFALFVASCCPGAKLIDMDPGYSARCIEALRRAVTGSP